MSVTVNTTRSAMPAIAAGPMVSEYTVGAGAGLSDRRGDGPDAGASRVRP